MNSNSPALLEMPSSRISVIIPAYNEERYIRHCLDSLLLQTVPVEIIVVDDGSTDRTASIVASYPQVILVRQQHRGPAIARNLGVEHSSGQILVFCDADMAFAPNYVERLIAPIEQGLAVGTFSKEEYVANYDNPWARCWNLHYGLTSNRRHPDDYPDEQPQFRAIRREAFLAAGGYSDTGYGEDVSIAVRLGQMAHMAPGAVCYHYNPGSLKEVFQSARWIGRGNTVPKTWKVILRHTLPWSLRSIAKRTWRFRNPYLPLFKIVYDFGVLAGIFQALRNPQKHWK